MKPLNAIYVSVVITMLACSTLHAQTSYDLLEKKRCAELFPNLVADYLARTECIGEIDKRIEKQKAAERAAAAKEQRENAARSCVAADIPRVEGLLRDIKALILNDYNDKLRGNSSYNLVIVQSLIKGKYSSINLSIQAADDNIKDKVLIFSIRTNCDSAFHFLANIRANSNDELQWYRLWAQEPPKGYNVSWNQLSEWGIDFVALKKEYELSSVVAQPGQTGWTPDSATNCKVWNPSPEPNETVTWSGSCVNGFAEGYGITTWYKNGRVNQIWKSTRKGGRDVDGPTEGTYMETNRIKKGNFGNNEWNGKIRITDLNGNLIYDGYVKDSKYHGTGTLINPDRSRYVGNFAFNGREGYGSEYDSTGKLIYEGNHVQNKKSGAGHLYFPEGDYFDGNFVDGYMNGSGNVYWVKGGSTYVIARMGCAWSGTTLVAFQKSTNQCKLERGVPQ